ncbi:hypothetical protein GUJ93_ZPchr0008g12159 [Zizania palustris]|uniref:Uncharacterized protein n=1 Tax=Zizania palustris TaxID=103762 RepID=A0A8J5R4F0_ZIZPA|nr:hypothetical protein GUJ93_ZPchr0008g12159 [Zizania palustris]
MDETNCNKLEKPVNDENTSFLSMEDLEAFIGSIPQKIEQGLCSEDADLENLAGRLVGLSVHALMIRHGKIAVRYSDRREIEDASDGKIASNPKELVSKYKDSNSICAASQQILKHSTSYKIREHELQILLRMEIMKSELGPGIEEGSKQKLIKEICSLLQFIDINLQVDSFQSNSIVEFAEKTIKIRCVLPASVHVLVYARCGESTASAADAKVARCDIVRCGEHGGHGAGARRSWSDDLDGAVARRGVRWRDEGVQGDGRQ